MVILSVFSHYILYNNSKFIYEKYTHDILNFISKSGIKIDGDIVPTLIPYLTSIFQYVLVFYIGRSILYFHDLINKQEYDSQTLFLHPSKWNVLNIVSVVSLLTHSFLSHDIGKLSDTIIKALNIKNNFANYIVHMMIYGIFVWFLSSLFMMCKTRVEGVDNKPPAKKNLKRRPSAPPPSFTSLTWEEKLNSTQWKEQCCGPESAELPKCQPEGGLSAMTMERIQEGFEACQ